MNQALLVAFALLPVRPFARNMRLRPLLPPEYFRTSPRADDVPQPWLDRGRRGLRGTRGGHPRRHRRVRIINERINK